MSSQPIRLRTDQLRAVPLEAVLRLWGAQPDRYDRRKWHTAQGILSVTGTKFMNWNCGLGGGGAIDLVIHLSGLPFLQALQWLADHFPAPALPPASAPPRPAVQLPPPDPDQLARVRHYLIAKRALAPARIDPLIQAGALYADAKANAVFLLLNQKNAPVGAELRGTGPHPWRGMAPGSQKDLGFFAVPPLPLWATDPAPAPIVLCESAIDAISCWTLHPGYRCLSTAGARSNPRWLAPLLHQGHQVHCGFDTDPTGEAMAQAMMTLHPSVRRLAPAQHDWNDVLRSES